MKKLIVSIVLAALALASFAQTAQKPDYKSLTAKNHPRLFFTEKAFVDLRKQIAKGDNPYLTALHECMMSQAVKKGLDCSPMPFDREKKKQTYNETSRRWSTRIITAAYAYRVTGDVKYLEACEANILTYASDFPKYTTGYWLENSEVCMSLGLAYDWLYKSLSKNVKKVIVDAIATIGYDDAADEKKAWFYKCNHNWNSVCNATLVCAAIATYEKHPERSAAVIEKAIATNPLALTGIYDPDGASPEGPSYWDYATNYECVLLMALEDNFGTDFGLSAYPGFEKGADYRLFAVGNTGKWFNYADCNSGRPSGCLALWYYAWKFGKKDCLYRDIPKLGPRYTGGSRALFMAIAAAQRMGTFESKVPESLLFSAKGSVEIVIARSGWNEKDAFLGLKAGKAKVNHAHLDEGVFIYEADGLRWASEFPHPTYEIYRRAQKALKKEGKKFDFFDEFYRSPLSHSVMMVDGKCPNTHGHSVISATVDTPERRGGTIDFCDMYAGQLASASRSAYIVNGRDLEVRDCIAALPQQAAHVRWNFVTEADVEIVENSIVLTQKGQKKVLRTTAPGAVFRTWSSNPADYDDSPVRPLEPDYTKYCHICSFEFDVPAGQNMEILTTIAD